MLWPRIESLGYFVSGTISTEYLKGGDELSDSNENQNFAVTRIS